MQALEAHLQNNSLVFGLFSGDVFPRKDAKLLCVMAWNITHDVPAGIAAINAWQSGHWLMFESEKGLAGAIAQAERKFSAWLKKGGLHDHNRYRSVNNCMEMPSDFMEAEKMAEEQGKGLWNSETCNGDTTKSADPQESIVEEVQEPQVKKSTSGICHERDVSVYYINTKNYTPYDTIEACLDSGGRLPEKY